MAAAERLKYWEDFELGAEATYGTHRVTEPEIIDFARRYDPQVFHTDPERARETAFGGLVASGWQTILLFTSMLIREELVHAACQGSPGIDEVRWLVPVRPDDELTARSRVIEKWPSKTTALRGTVVFLSEMVNQRGEVVLRYRCPVMMGRRA